MSRPWTMNHPLLKYAILYSYWISRFCQSLIRYRILKKSEVPVPPVLITCFRFTRRTVRFKFSLSPQAALTWRGCCNIVSATTTLGLVCCLIMLHFNSPLTFIAANAKVVCRMRMVFQRFHCGNLQKTSSVFKYVVVMNKSSKMLFVSVIEMYSG